MKMENVGSYTLDNNRPTLSTLGLMDYPISLYIDRNGLVMVADRYSWGTSSPHLFLCLRYYRWFVPEIRVSSITESLHVHVFVFILR